MHPLIGAAFSKLDAQTKSICLKGNLKVHGFSIVVHLRKNVWVKLRPEIY